MEVTTRELRQAVTKLLDHLDEAGHGLLNINNDYYWSIPANQRYDPYKEPAKFTLGQLSDDWSEIKRIIAGESAPIGYGLVWLSAVIRAIGEEEAP